MLNALSVVIGVATLLFAVVAFTPLLGWGYWLILPFSLVGALLGFLSDKNTGRNLNLLVLAVGVFRLFLGGGVI